MKGVIVVLDGIADLPNEKLGGKTPLEAAKKPYLDELAGNSELGYLYPVNEKFAPESDKGMLHLFARDKTIISRGQLESIGAGIDLQPGDLALRANFATINNFEEKKIVDRRVGRTLSDKEAQVLAAAINKGVKLQHPFIFQPTVQHRGVLVIKGGFSDNISDTDPAYAKAGKIASDDKVKESTPLDEKELTEHTAQQVNAFIRQSYEILNNHSLNVYRKSKNLLPANIILVRGAGTQLPKVEKFNNWAAVAYMPLEKGIAQTFGMHLFAPQLSMEISKSYAVLNKILKKAAKYSVKTIWRNRKEFDYFYIHIKETDLPGHDNKPEEKKVMIELLDKYLFYYLLKLQKKEPYKLIVTGDHATPCSKAGHSADPVPFLILNQYAPGKQANFCEKTVLETKNKIYGNQLLKKAGFV